MDSLLAWFNQKNVRISAFVTALLVCLGITFSYYHWYIPNQLPICEFDPEHDTPKIASLFEADRYWLTPNPDTSIEYLLKHRTPNKNPLNFGKLTIKVLRENDQVAGFIMYYMKSPTIGMILFLQINPAFRGKGYGAKLVKYALKELRKMNAERVELVTRTSNAPARKTYVNVGFKETEKNEEFVHYQYTW